MINGSDDKIEDMAYEIVGSETFTLVSGSALHSPKERWPGYKKVRQKAISGGPCRLIGALLKETPKLYIVTSETNLESPFHFTRHLKKTRFHIEPCTMCPDNQPD